MQIKAHELINEGTQAQPVVQNLTPIKMKESLYVKGEQEEE